MKLKYYAIIVVIAIGAFFAGLWSERASAGLNWGTTRYGHRCWSKEQAIERGYILRNYYPTYEACIKHLESLSEG